MPVSIQVDHAKRRVVGVASGVLEDKELFAYQQEAGRFPVYDEIFDGTAVEHLQNVDPASLKKLASVAASTDVAGQRSRLAIVAALDVHYGMGRMYESFRECEPHTIREAAVFHSREEAERWLDTGES